ncbi:MAG: hypothetical protein QW607_07880, partial [Desulfurococcaceae archaeon]
MKINRKEYNDHATAGEICNVLKNLGLKTENSIFGEKSEARILRNKVSHANIFYDKYEDKIIIANNKYDLEEFERFFKRIILFLLTFLKRLFNINDFSNFENIFLEKYRKVLRELSFSFS